MDWVYVDSQHPTVILTETPARLLSIVHEGDEVWGSGLQKQVAGLGELRDLRYEKLSFLEKWQHHTCLDNLNILF